MAEKRSHEMHVFHVALATTQHRSKRKCILVGRLVKVGLLFDTQYRRMHHQINNCLGRFISFPTAIAKESVAWDVHHREHSRVHGGVAERLPCIAWAWFRHCRNAVFRNFTTSWKQNQLTDLKRTQSLSCRIIQSPPTPTVVCTPSTEVIVCK